jgi:hypothetical protein
MDFLGVGCGSLQRDGSGGHHRGDTGYGGDLEETTTREFRLRIQVWRRIHFGASEIRLHVDLL